jgi:hypothetical protein
MTHPLSPAAQAVLDAFNREARPEPHHQREAIAAAIRAVAHQVTSKNGFFLSPGTATQIRSDLYVIAFELEGSNG